jgi:DNA-binding protein HU-beta
MNKVELAEKIAERVGLAKSQAEAVLEAFTDITIETLKNAGEITLAGFGTFSARRRKGREGINPRNPQEKIEIPSVVVAKFKAGKNLKDVLKGKAKPIETAKEETTPAAASDEPAV